MAVYAFSDIHGQRVLFDKIMKCFKPNDIIYHKTLVQIKRDFTIYKEYKTILTDKKNGETFNSNYKFISSTITDIPEDYSIKINRRFIP